MTFSFITGGNELTNLFSNVICLKESTPLVNGKACFLRKMPFPAQQVLVFLGVFFYI